MPLSAYCCWCAIVVHVLEPEACRQLRSTHLQVGQVGPGPSSAVQAWGAVPSCERWMGMEARFFYCVGVRDGRGPWLRTLALVGNRMERVDAMHDGSAGGASGHPGVSCSESTKEVSQKSPKREVIHSLKQTF
jgi:hypothetical protein